MKGLGVVHRDVVTLHPAKRSERSRNVNTLLLLIFEDVPLVEFMYLVFTSMPGESYRRRPRSLLYLCYLFQALINLCNDF